MKINIITLGCKTNQSESEEMAVKLANFGFEVGFDISPADIYILNTCSITAEADKKSRQLVARVKKCNPNADIFVCGCSSQNNPIPFEQKEGVRLVVGCNKFKIVDEILARSRMGIIPQPLKLKTRRYLKIQDGCNNFCTYCIVPYLRGRECSDEIGLIVAKAKNLSKTCKEIVLTGINMSSFGSDTGETFLGLINALVGIDSRIRIGSLEPRIITSELLAALKKLNKFCPHFHLSMQSGSDDVLKNMNRHYSSSEFIKKADLIRKFFPDAFIACDVIVGFPTESERNFEETIDTINRVKYSFMHIFPYSRREGTYAARLKQIDPCEMKKRVFVLQEINKRLNLEYLNSLLGKEEELLVEKVENGIAEGYGLKYVRCYLKDETLSEGDLVKVKLVSLFKDGILCEKI